MSPSSDGLSGLVSNEQIHEIVTKSESLEAGCQLLIERANFFGGTDNITAVLARVEDESGGPPMVGPKPTTPPDTEPAR